MMVRPILSKLEEQESPPEALAGVEPAPNTKRRCVSSACIPCRRRKSKCDGAMPACATCKAVYRMECMYDFDGDGRRRRRKSIPGGGEGRNTNSLDETVPRIRTAAETEVESIVEQLWPTGSLQSITSTATTAVEFIKHEKRKSIPEPVKEPAGIVVKNVGELQVDEEGAVRHYGYSSNLGSIRSRSRKTYQSSCEMQGVDWTTVTTDDKLIFDLLDLYFTWHHPVHVLFSTSCFLTDMRRRRKKYCSPLLFNAVLALACHYSTNVDARANPADPSTRGDHFFGEAQRLLLAEESHSSLTVTQALALMAAREAGCGRDATSWMYLGRSLHVALDLGLHLPLEASTTMFTLTEVEVRRITFWALFVMDKQWSMHFGRIPQLPCSVVGIPKPNIIQELENDAWTAPDGSRRPCQVMQIATQYAELAEVLGDALRVLHSPRQQLDAVKLKEYHTRLKIWREKIPKSLDPQQNAVPAVFVLHMFYHSIILLIFRPFEHQHLSSFTDSPRQISVNAAIETCTIYSYLRNARFDKRPVCMVPHMLLSAALVFVQESMMLNGSGSGRGGTSQALSFTDGHGPIASFAANLEECVVGLRDMSSTWELAEQALRVISRRAATIEPPPPPPPRPRMALHSETISSSSASGSISSAQESPLPVGMRRDSGDLGTNMIDSAECDLMDCGTGSAGSSDDSGGLIGKGGCDAGAGGIAASIDETTTIEDILKEVGGEMSLGLDIWGVT